MPPPALTDQALVVSPAISFADHQYWAGVAVK
jgi:hypothetical protein